MNTLNRSKSRPSKSPSGDKNKIQKLNQLKELNLQSANNQRAKKSQIYQTNLTVKSFVTLKNQENLTLSLKNSNTSSRSPFSNKNLNTKSIDYQSEVQNKKVSNKENKPITHLAQQSEKRKVKITQSGEKSTGSKSLEANRRANSRYSNQKDPFEEEDNQNLRNQLQEEENVSDDSGNKQKQTKKTQGLKDLQVKLKKENKEMYNFSQNVDYSKVTENQKKKFLRKQEDDQKLQKRSNRQLNKNSSKPQKINQCNIQNYLVSTKQINNKSSSQDGKRNNSLSKQTSKGNIYYQILANQNLKKSKERIKNLSQEEPTQDGISNTVPVFTDKKKPVNMQKNKGSFQVLNQCRQTSRESKKKLQTAKITPRNSSNNSRSTQRLDKNIQLFNKIDLTRNIQYTSVIQQKKSTLQKAQSSTIVSNNMKTNRQEQNNKQKSSKNSKRDSRSVSGEKEQKTKNCTSTQNLNKRQNSKESHLIVKPGKPIVSINLSSDEKPKKRQIQQYDDQATESGSPAEIDYRKERIAPSTLDIRPPTTTQVAQSFQSTQFLEKKQLWRPSIDSQRPSLIELPVGSINLYLYQSDQEAKETPHFDIMNSYQSLRSRAALYQEVEKQTQPFIEIQNQLKTPLIQIEVQGEQRNGDHFELQNSRYTQLTDSQHPSFPKDSSIKKEMPVSKLKQHHLAHRILCKAGGEGRVTDESFENRGEMLFAQSLSLIQQDTQLLCRTPSAMQNSPFIFGSTPGSNPRIQEIVKTNLPQSNLKQVNQIEMKFNYTNESLRKPTSKNSSYRQKSNEMDEKVGGSPQSSYASPINLELGNISSGKQNIDKNFCPAMASKTSQIRKYINGARQENFRLEQTVLSTSQSLTINEDENMEEFLVEIQNNSLEIQNNNNDSVTQFHQQNTNSDAKITNNYYIQETQMSQLTLQQNQLGSPNCAVLSINKQNLTSPEFGATNDKPSVKSSSCRKNDQNFRGTLVLDYSEPGDNNVADSPCSCDECKEQNNEQINNQKESILTISNLADHLSPVENQQSPSQNNLDKTDKKNQFYQVNFEALFEQQQMLLQLKELMEIRPSAVFDYAKYKKEVNLKVVQQQAIEGLQQKDRVLIQKLCQDWWDSTQRDNSIFLMATQYQQYVQETYNRSNIHVLKLTESEIVLLRQESLQRGQSMRQAVILQSVIVGMTAFYSMLSRGNFNLFGDLATQGQKNEDDDLNNQVIKKELELRNKISRLLRISYDQFMLCQSFSLGKLSTFDRAIQTKKNPETWEQKFFTAYSEHFHLLFINKKIQNEDDYAIYNIKLQQPGPRQLYIANEENRDYQVAQLSRQLFESIIRIIDAEILIQKSLNNSGNVELLYVMKDISENSADIDFQEAKNFIFKGISQSEVLPEAEQSCQNPNEKLSTEGYLPTDQTYGDETDVYEGSVAPLQIDRLELQSNDLQKNYQNNDMIQYQQQVLQTARLAYGTNLIKTFNNDANQIIQEESREESVSLSAINYSRFQGSVDGP